MNEDVRETRAKSTGMMGRVGTYAAIVAIAFLAGFVPMWLKSRESNNNLVAAQRTLGLAQMQNSLASAVIDARRGDYEPARQAASGFYSSLRADIDKGENAALTTAQRTAAQELFAGRDEIITLLARSDPASADRLSDVYAAYRKIING
jgi:hypothetical protein